MCTVSWLPAAGGYTLYCNRDERRSRAPALPPAVRERAGMRFLAPLDGESGGSWLAANEAGLTLSLLNRYRVDGYTAPPVVRSRGLLLLDLVASTSGADALATLGAGNLKAYQPFSLVLVTPDLPASLARWDGSSLDTSTIAAAGLLATSSALHEAEAVDFRRSAFAGLVPVSAVGLERLHRSHAPERGGRSVCMHRPDAETRSFSRVEVTPEWIVLRHTSAAPCEGAPTVSLELPRLIAATRPVR